MQVCLFAYGQTGSGKTHTMLGGGTAPRLHRDWARPGLPHLAPGPDVAAGGDAAGIIPRSIRQIMSTAATMKEQGWEYKLQACTHMHAHVYTRAHAHAAGLVPRDLQ